MQLQENAKTGELATDMMQQFVGAGLVEHNAGDEFIVHGSHGDKQFKEWRRGYRNRPPPVSPFAPEYPGNDERCAVAVSRFVGDRHAGPVAAHADIATFDGQVLLLFLSASPQRPPRRAVGGFMYINKK